MLRKTGGGAPRASHKGSYVTTPSAAEVSYADTAGQPREHPPQVRPPRDKQFQIFEVCRRLSACVTRSRTSDTEGFHVALLQILGDSLVDIGSRDTTIAAEDVLLAGRRSDACRVGAASARDT